jgi:hypothetical protein
MGGAFVAVASDSSATWWNPAGLGAGPFFDAAWAKSLVEISGRLPAARHSLSSFTVGVPPIGFSYYRFHVTDIQPFRPTEQSEPSREDQGAEVSVRSLSASQLGVTIVHTLTSGVHAGATLKYLRGSLQHALDGGSMAPEDLLDRGEALDDGDTDNEFDMDVGAIAVTGPLRLGMRVAHILEPEFGTGAASSTQSDEGLRLPRQVRIGAAFDPEPLTGVPLTIALDADVRAYDTGTGARRMVALGAEQWLLSRRMAVRAGGRINTVGARGGSATAGISLSMRAGFFVDGYVVLGQSDDEHGWGFGARVSF